MPKPARTFRPSAVLASILTSLPVLWALWFAIVYRCDLRRYAHLWGSGSAPAWLTVWELSVTVAGVVVAFFLAPSIAKLWAHGRPLSRSEWMSMVIIVAMVGLAIVIAPGAMLDLSARIDLLLGNTADVCRH